MAHDAIINGTLGQIKVPEFWRAKGFSIGEENFSHEYEGVGLHFQVSAASRCIQSGKCEFKEMPWQDNINIMKVTDQIRRSGGLSYPTETLI